MRLNMKFREQVMGIGNWLVSEFDQLMSAIRSAWLVEHTEDDGHSDITAYSITLTKDTQAGLTGAVTAGGAGHFGAEVESGGDVTAWKGNVFETILGMIGTLGLGISMRKGLGWALVSFPGGPADEFHFYDRKNFPLDGVVKIIYDGTNYFVEPGSVVNTAKPIYLGEDAAGKRWAGIYVGTLKITGKALYSGEISPAQITANQNDYAPAGLADATVVVITSDAARDITGIALGEGGKRQRWINGGNFSITLKFENAGSTAANRILAANSADVVIRPNGSADLHYLASNSRWWALGV